MSGYFSNCVFIASIQAFWLVAVAAAERIATSPLPSSNVAM